MLHSDLQSREVSFNFHLTFLKLRTVPTIVTAHIFCACQGSRAQRERNAQHAGHVHWFCLRQVWEVLVISCGKDASFFNR